MGLEEFGTATQVQEKTKRWNGDQPAMATAMYPKRQELSGPVQWTNYGYPNQYIPCRATRQVLPAAVYSITTTDNSPMFVEQPLNLDDLYFFQDSVAEETIDEIEKFWASGTEYVRYGFRQRRGYLLYGPQGSGKSSIVLQAQERIVSHGGIIFLCDCPPGLTADALKVFRMVEPERPVLCIFEDLDAIMNRHGEPEILSLLDGEDQIDRVLNIATTNYPENLPRRIIRRPRRFDRVIKVGMPEENVRRAYFARKLASVPENPGVQALDIEELVRLSKGLSFAAMAEIIISVRCLGLDLYETVTTMREMQDTTPTSDDYEGERKTGFRRDD